MMPKINAIEIKTKRIIPDFYGRNPDRLQFVLLIYQAFALSKMDSIMRATAGQRWVFCSVMPSTSRMFLRSV